ncbi:MAG: hypothetical protein Q8N81_04155, partial [bacterium]|nr:hypothetical protein [bacterium]
IVFYGVFISGYTQTEIIYVKPNPKPLLIIDKNFFSSGENRYYASARVSNPNSDLAVRSLKYRFIFKAADGSTLSTVEKYTYVLPNQERFLFLPAQTLSGPPKELEVELIPERWSKINQFKGLNFSFEQLQYGKDSDGRFFASAVLKNENPYIIPEIELGVILYNIKHEVLGINYTTLNDVRVEEQRFFRMIWPLGTSFAGVVDVEFKPSVNLLLKGSLLLESAQPVDYLKSETP